MASDSAQPPHDPPPAYLRQGRIEPPEQQPGLPPEDTVGRRWGVPALIAWVTLSAFAGALWFAYEQGVRKGMDTTPPLIKADTSPVKVPPDDPGGMEVPHQDKEIYERMAGSESTGQEEERLRPDSERPAPKEELLAAAEKSESTGGTTTISVPPLPKITDAGENESAAETAESGVAKAAETKESPDGKEEVTLPPPVPLQPKAAEPAQDPAPKTEEAAAPQTAAMEESAPASATLVGSSFRVQLGAYRSAEAAEGDWGRLSTREEALLGSLDHLVLRVDLGAKGIYYRLQAGPLEGPGAARTMCNKLQQRKLGCLVVRPAAR